MSQASKHSHIFLVQGALGRGWGCWGGGVEGAGMKMKLSRPGGPTTPTGLPDSYTC